MIRKHLYWMPVWILATLIVAFVAIRTQSYWPLGSERFVYPLRILSDTMWWHLSRLVEALLVMYLYTIPLAILGWVAWFILTEYYPQNPLLDGLGRSLRVYFTALFVAICGLFFVGPVPSETIQLDSTRLQDNHYHLTLREVYAMPIVYLYECDASGIVCESVVQRIAWADDWTHETLQLGDDGDSVFISNGERILYIHPGG